MNVLKKLFLVSFSVLFITSAVGIWGLIKYETNWFRDKVLLYCTVDNRNIDFSLVIDRKNKNVLFSGRTKEEDKFKRELKLFSDTNISIEWKDKDNLKVSVFLHRLSGKFSFEYPAKVKNTDTKERKTLCGYCREKNQIF